MQDAFGIVLFVVMGVAVCGAIASLIAGARMYDEIGRGGLSIGEDRDAAPRPPAPVAGDARERDAEIRQMLAARNRRRAARGEAQLDVETELAALRLPAVDEGLRDEVRALVEARNARRVAKGRPPLDVEAEVARRLRELAG